MSATCHTSLRLQVQVSRIPMNLKLDFRLGAEGFRNEMPTRALIRTTVLNVSQWACRGRRLSTDGRRSRVMRSRRPL